MTRAELPIAMNRAAERTQRALIEPTAPNSDFPRHEEADSDAILAPLRKRGSGINLRNQRPTLPRMGRILRLLGLTVAQHSEWSGYDRKVWLKQNPAWTEREWAVLVAENLDAIRDDGRVTEVRDVKELGMEG